MNLVGLILAAGLRAGDRINLAIKTPIGDGFAHEKGDRCPCGPRVDFIGGWASIWHRELEPPERWEWTESVLTLVVKECDEETDH